MLPSGASVVPRRRRSRPSLTSLPRCFLKPRPRRNRDAGGDPLRGSGHLVPALNCWPAPERVAGGVLRNDAPLLAGPLRSLALAATADAAQHAELGRQPLRRCWPATDGDSGCDPAGLRLPPAVCEVSTAASASSDRSSLLAPSSCSSGTGAPRLAPTLFPPCPCPFLLLFIVKLPQL